MNNNSAEWQREFYLTHGGVYEEGRRTGEGDDGEIGGFTINKIMFLRSEKYAC